MDRQPIDWNGFREMRERHKSASAITDAMDVMFPYRDYRDDPVLTRGQAQKVLERALGYRPLENQRKANQ